MALPVNGSTHLIPALLLIYRPRKDERLSWPSWLTGSGWFTHISGHPSVAGRAQDRESSPVRDRRSTTVPRHQHDETNLLVFAVRLFAEQNGNFQLVLQLLNPLFVSQRPNFQYFSSAETTTSVLGCDDNVNGAGCSTSPTSLVFLFCRVFRRF